VSGSDGVLKELVRRAHGAGVRRIMWDGLNPKPIASRRMVASVPSLQADLGLARTGAWSSRVRIRLAEECGSAGIALVDAF